MAVSRFGRIIRNVAIIASTLAAMSVGALVLKYHEETQIDRSVSKVVVRDYIDAALVKRDRDRERLYVCASPNLESISILRRQLVAEESSGVATHIVVASALESDEGHVVDVLIQLNQSSGIQIDRRTQYWRFGMVDQEGWRVCSAEQLPGPAPSASVTPPTTS